MKFKEDIEWSNQYIDQIIKILQEHAGLFLTFHPSSKQEDILHGSDLVILVTGQGDVAVRVRREDCQHRDLTIRAKRDGGTKTELQKIRDGCVRWYFYGWTKNGRLDEWMLVDVDRLRSSGLLENQKLISNRDGTYFIAIHRSDLQDCIVAEKHKKL